MRLHDSRRDCVLVPHAGAQSASLERTAALCGPVPGVPIRSFRPSRSCKDARLVGDHAPLREEALPAFQNLSCSSWKKPGRTLYCLSPGISNGPTAVVAWPPAVLTWSWKKIVTRLARTCRPSGR